MNVRKSAVAGQFYPADPDQLRKQVSDFLRHSQEQGSVVKAVMVPHAGYDFSGKIAGAAFGQLRGLKYDNVILLGNGHATYTDMISIDSHDSWQTPLGRIDVNLDLAKKLCNGRNIVFNDNAHLDDHVLEVELPFLQVALKSDFKIMPILFGQTENGFLELAEQIEKNISGNDLIVISSDMSHYPSYDDANLVDQKTLEIIKTLDVDKLDDHISKTMAENIPNEQTLLCGIDAVKTVMVLAKKNKWQAKIVAYANSGEVAIGDKNRVVGYGAIIFFA